MPPDRPVSDLTAQLLASRSSLRRAAARALRRLQDHAAGPALVQALQVERRDPRTWKTQYQLIMALGECQIVEAIPLLQDVAGTPLDASVIHVAAGDALIRLASTLGGVRVPDMWAWMLDRGNVSVLEGALRGTALADIRLEATTVDRIVRVLQVFELDHPVMFWAAVAARTWTAPAARALLDDLIDCGRADVREAARQARAGKAVHYHVL